MIEVRIRHIDDANGIYAGEFSPDEILQLRKAFMIGIKIESILNEEKKTTDPHSYFDASYCDSRFIIDEDEQFYYEIIVKED